MSTWTPPGKIAPDGTHYQLLGPLDSRHIVLCVHGIGSFHSVFDDLADQLAASDFKVVQYDLLGRGFSSNHSTEKFDAEAHLDQMRRLVVETLAIVTPIHIVAHSMGGALTALYAAKYPKDVLSVTLLAPAGLMNPGPLPLIRNVSCMAAITRSILSQPAQQKKAWRNDFYNHQGRYLESEEATVRRMQRMYDNNPGAFNAFWQSVLQFPLYGLDQEVKQMAENENLSVFVLWGKNDVAVPLEPSFSRWTAALNAGKCTLTTKQLDNAGHGFLLEYPEHTNADILKFLTKVSGNGAADNVM